MFKDPILQKLAEEHPAPDWSYNSAFLFQRMIRAIIVQQLSIKVAEIIYARFIRLFESREFPSPSDVLKMDKEKLRAIGISYSKISYMKNVAEAFDSGQLSLEKIQDLSDEQVVAELTRIKGIGRWTAEMILIFTLNRPDVFSSGDAGLRRAIEILYGITDLKDIVKLSETWSPNRSLACWYLWRSLEKTP